MSQVFSSDLSRIIPPTNGGPSAQHECGEPVRFWKQFLPNPSAHGERPFCGNFAATEWRSRPGHIGGLRELRKQRENFHRYQESLAPAVIEKLEFRRSKPPFFRLHPHRRELKNRCQAKSPETSPLGLFCNRAVSTVFPRYGSFSQRSKDPLGPGISRNGHRHSDWASPRGVLSTGHLRQPETVKVTKNWPSSDCGSCFLEFPPPTG